MRYAKRRDNNHTDIVEALRKANFKAKGGRLSEGQKRFQGLFQPRGEWYEARDPDDTVCALQALYLQRLK
jgi:hypothetical protein